MTDVSATRIKWTILGFRFHNARLSVLLALQIAPGTSSKPFGN